MSILVQYQTQDAAIPAPTPPIADPATRARLSPTAVQAFFRLARLWDLTDADQLELLGASISRATLHAWRTGGPKVALSIDQLTRISCLLAVYEGLQRIFRRAPEEGDRWIRRPRPEPPFAGASPLDVMIREGIPGLVAVRRFVDDATGGPPSRELEAPDTRALAATG